MDWKGLSVFGLGKMKLPRPDGRLLLSNRSRRPHRLSHLASLGFGIQL